MSIVPGAVMGNFCCCCCCCGGRLCCWVWAWLGRNCDDGPTGAAVGANESCWEFCCICWLKIVGGVGAPDVTVVGINDSCWELSCWLGNICCDGADGTRAGTKDSCGLGCWLVSVCCDDEAPESPVG